MKLVLPSLITNFQGDFIHERQISDGILIAAELIDSRKRKNKSGFVCKVDFTKAFDNIKWNSADIVLQRFIFGNIWRGWIKWCISRARFFILVNGEATPCFKSQKGIRQGDHIYPFLFITVAEILSKMIQKAASFGLLFGFKVSTNGSLINDLQLADDLIVLIDDMVNQISDLKDILSAF